MIVNGHSFDAIQYYTLQQIELFSLAIHSAKAEQIRNSAIAARAAQMKQTDFKKFMRG